MPGTPAASASLRSPKNTGAFKDDKAAKREIVLSAAHRALIVLSVYINFQEVNITEKQE